ncbi:unnamed protein product, partial [Rotaria magnacalcarata]
SEPRIGGTYMTLVSTLGNIGQTVSSSVVLAIASKLPKKHAYSIEVAGCTVLGIFWLLLTWRMMHRLQSLPIQKWYSVNENYISNEISSQETSDVSSSNKDDIVSKIA